MIFFKAKEIANLLGYRNTKDAIIRHVEIEDKLTFDKLQGLGNTTPIQNTTP